MGSGSLEQAADFGKGCTELGAEATEAPLVVCENAKDEFGRGVVLGDFGELIGVIERHHLNADGRCVANEGSRLAWVGVNDALWGDTEGEDELDLSLRSTVESQTEICQQ